MDIHCVTKWSKFDTTWEGVKIQTLVDEGLLKLKPEANFVIQHAEYGYTANLPVEVIFGENFLLATHFDGEPITPEHGYPAARRGWTDPRQGRVLRALFLEGGQMAARPGVPGGGPAGVLGAGRLPQRSRRVERAALRAGINYPRPSGLGK